MSGLGRSGLCPTYDPVTAAVNATKHHVAFDEAMTVFADPLALSRLDDAHGSLEERWVTIGLSHATNLLLVVHTHVELTQDHVCIRIISARKPTKREKRDYEQASAKAASEMKREYDFSSATCGKFFRKDAVLVPPVRLEPDVLAYLQARATAKGTRLSDLVNQLLKKDIELIEAGR